MKCDRHPLVSAMKAYLKAANRNPGPFEKKELIHTLARSEHPECSKHGVCKWLLLIDEGTIPSTGSRRCPGKTLSQFLYPRHFLPYVVLAIIEMEQALQH